MTDQGQRQILLEVGFDVTPEPGDKPLDDTLDAAYEHLTGALGVRGASFVSDSEGASGSFLASMLVDVHDDESPDDAAARAATQLRTAFHAVGCSTPSWLQSTATPVDRAPSELVHA